MKMTQEQFDKAQKTFSKKSLSDIQKHAMLSRIYSEDVVPNQPIVSPFNSYFILFRQKSFVAIAVVVLLVSGTSYASAQSLPGDPLYGMKVNVLEPMGLALRFSEESKNEYKISLLKKRVEELEKLKQRGEISENSRQDSSRATNKNVKDLENTSIFDEEGENDYVSEKIKIYNNLIGSELQIKTEIEIDRVEKLKIQGEIEIEKEIINNVEPYSPRAGNGSFDEYTATDVQTEGSVEVDEGENLPLNLDQDPDIDTKVPRL